MFPLPRTVLKGHGFCLQVGGSCVYGLVKWIFLLNKVGPAVNFPATCGSEKKCPLHIHGMTIGLKFTITGTVHSDPKLPYPAVS